MNAAVTKPGLGWGWASLFSGRVGICTATKALLVSLSFLVLAACNTRGRGDASRVETDDTLELRVAESPPDSVPLAIWSEIHAPENVEQSAPEWSTPFPRNIVLIMFREQASRGEKQQAIDAVAGVVVGGAPLGKGGYYYVRIKDDGTSRPLFRAIEKLKSFRQVESATPELPDVSPLGRRDKRP